LIDDETFVREKKELQSKITQLRCRMRETESRTDKWLELTEKTFKFATYARKAFITGRLELKKEILIALGERPVIKGGKLYIEPNEWLQPIAKDYPPLEKEYLRLEPTQMLANKEESVALEGILQTWLRR